MQPLVTLKVDPRMKAALKKLADKQFISVSAVLKQAAEKHLNDNGIDWRREDPKASKE
jgi:predicted transcriptional regulator